MKGDFITYADAETAVQTLLTNGWDDTNTDSLTPKFIISSDKKRVDLGLLKQDAILIYERNRQNIKNSTGATSKREHYNVSLDCRTSSTRAHFLKVLGEAERVIDAAILSPGAGYSLIDPTGTYPLHSDKLSKFWRGIVEVKLIKLNVVRDA